MCWGDDDEGQTTPPSAFIPAPYPYTDADEDGYIAFEDCDDDDPNSTLIIEDATCDGTVD